MHGLCVYRCQVNIGTPENGHPGCPFSRKNTHPDAYIYVNMGIRMPKFTVDNFMGIPYGCLYSHEYGHQGPYIIRENRHPYRQTCMHL